MRAGQQVNLTVAILGGRMGSIAMFTCPPDPIHSAGWFHVSIE